MYYGLWKYVPSYVMYKGKLLSTYIGHWTVWSLDIHTSNVGAVFIDDDDVPWDKEVAAKENEAIFDSLHFHLTAYS